VADAVGLVDLAAAVASEPEGWLLADGGWRTVWGERRYIRTVIRHPDAALLVAELRGTIVGRLSLVRDPHPSSAHIADIGLMVASEHRRQGIGSALLVAAEEWAREAHIDKLELHVFPYNLAAIALYCKAGYEHEGVRRRHFRRAGGELVDAVLMARHLA